MYAKTGLFETMFGGFGGEFLYRPFDKNYSIGFTYFKLSKENLPRDLIFKTMKLPQDIST